MKEMIKKVRERREGFTMAELLIVVAIIAVLVAIAIPVFTSQLEKSKESTDLANLRSAYAEATAEYLTTNSSGKSQTYTIQQGEANWKVASSGLENLKYLSSGEIDKVKTNTANTKFHVEFNGANAQVVIGS